MFELAGVREGARVLDVAAGDGDQALLALEIVGASGNVLATDLSRILLEFARESARDRGFENFDVQVMDGESLELPDSTFDSVISRFGLMFFPHPERGLSEMLRVLRPGGGCAVIVFTAPERTPWFSAPVSIIREIRNLPPPAPGTPGPFSLGAPGLLEESFRTAGFEGVASRVLSMPLELPSASECVRWLQEAAGALKEMLADVEARERSQAWSEIERSLSQFNSETGFQCPSEVLVCGGRAP
jgi:ubiquinone/menaquinone biosynthesis C-methylase UbiE